MRKSQAFNPYLPVDTYIPDVEPHVFDGRVYAFGSHDREGGDRFCMLDYEVWSAPVDDLGAWRNEGIVYRAEQDPSYGKPDLYMYAPDVVVGNDGRYYLYYAMSGGGRFTGPIHVAVCDEPAGRYEYWGEVRNPDGTPYTRGVTFDPAVMNDDGVIRLYYGWSLAVDPKAMPGCASPEDVPREQLIGVQMMLFGKTREQIETEPQGCMGAFTVELDDDMLTVRTEPKLLVPGQFSASGTSFEGHAFFEGSSIRRIGARYYFVYSSEHQHELCYATSDRPDGGFGYGGVIVSNGDIGYAQRPAANRLAATGNNHGGLVCLDGQWYVFYHRQTHKTTYSRQGCAEPIEIAPDGSIAQVEMTSCGLNGGPLVAEGRYPATICCNLTNGHMPHQGTDPIDEPMPHVDDDGTDRFVAQIGDGTYAAYKYFDLTGARRLDVTVRGQACGTLHVLADENAIGSIAINPTDMWRQRGADIDVDGVHALGLRYEGEGEFEMKDIIFGVGQAPEEKEMNS